MAIYFRWLARITLGLTALALLAVLGVYYLASRSLPQYSKTLDVAGLQNPVEIVRDNANVPHILGQSDHDSFFGLGYVHAQDRLWQMLILRRTAQGRLSELFGESTLQIDSTIRRMDIYALATQSVRVQDLRSTQALEAYSAGVNARIQEINDGALGRGAPEMFLFPTAMAPWQPADSLAIQKLMAIQLSGHVEEEVLRARLSLLLPDAKRLADILPDIPGDAIAEMPEYAAIMGDTLPVQTADIGAHHPLSPFQPRGLAGASGAWAASAERSATGATLMANDPHLGLSAPAIWYLARMDIAGRGVIGGTIPGMPSILSGRSDQLGWGLTSSYLDDQDILLEELNPENPDEYRTSEGFKPFATRKTIIKIKDREPVTLTLRWSVNGPVMSPTYANLASITPKGHVAALSATFLSPADSSLSAAIGIMYADTAREAIDATKGYIAPSQNLTLADQTTIAMKTIGAAPKRAPNHQSQGRIPSLGYLVENQWLGRFEGETNPEYYAPIGGILGNTNNKVIDRPFPEHISFTWGDSQRVERWKKLMQSRQVHTRDSFVEAQLDTVSYSARALLPLVGADLWFTGEAAPEGSQERTRQNALGLLANWNGEMNEHLPEPLIYAAWMRALQTRLIQDELGPLAQEIHHVEPLFIERVFRDVEGAKIWCDVIQSDQTETCADMARLALDDALLWIKERYGSQLESLRWGDAHQATHDHPVLGEVALLRYFVNIRQSTSGGDNTLQRGRTSGTGDRPFENVHAAGYRGVYDFADPDSSVFVIATGQSGHPLSRYYDDMSRLWRRGEYRPMSLDTELARAASVGITWLRPTAQ